MPTAKHNPRFLTDEELVRSYCIRGLEFESIVETLRDSATEASNQHVIVTGPRGSGKSTLALRVAAEARRGPRLASDWYPIVFAEECYSVSTCGEFWLECLRRLADQAPASDQGPELRAGPNEIMQDLDDRRVADRCLSVLVDFAEQRQRRLLLVVENLDMLFDQILDRTSPWRLRHTLQTEPRIFLLATATSRFGEIESPENALYSQFRVLDLQPMNAVECAALWESITNRHPDDGSVRALQILTAGNPRLFSIFARFDRDRSLRDLARTIKDAVDDHTEYFKNYIDSLPSQERRVFVALAELWRPATTREIAGISRLSSNQCSAQLRRLVKRGSVTIAEGTARKQRYSLTEPIFGLYHALRHGDGVNESSSRNLLNSLTFFMQVYYSKDELSELVSGEPSTTQGLNAKEVQGYLSLVHSIKKLTLDERFAVYKWSTKGHECMENEDYEQAAECFRIAVRECRISTDPEIRACLPDALLNRSATLAKLGQYALSEVIRDELVDKYSVSDREHDRECVAMSIANLGKDKYRQGQIEEAIALFDRALSMFDQLDTIKSAPWAANLYVSKSYALARLSKIEEAVRVADELDIRFGSVRSPETSREVLISLCNKALLLLKSGCTDDALAVVRDCTSRFNQEFIRKFSSVYIRLMRVNVAILDSLECRDDALRVCDRVIQRTDFVPDDEVADEIASIRLDRAQLLDEAGTWDEAVTEYGIISDAPVIGDYYADDETSLIAFVNQYVLLSKAERFDEAQAAYERIVERFSAVESPEIRQLFEKACLNKAASDSRRSDFHLAIQVAGRVLSRAATTESYENRARAHWIRAESYYQTDDRSSCLVEMRAALDLIRDNRELLARAIDNLKLFAVRLGEDAVLELISNSSARDRLRPLIVALQMEVGIDPVESQQVMSVASDIRRDLGELRDSESV